MSTFWCLPLVTHNVHFGPFVVQVFRRAFWKAFNRFPKPSILQGHKLSVPSASSEGPRALEAEDRASTRQYPR